MNAKRGSKTVTLAAAPRVGGAGVLLASAMAVWLAVPGGQVIGPAHADSLSNAQHCSSRTLRGAYGIRFQGQKVTGELFASVSRMTFDGNGQFTTSEVGRFNGVLVQRTFTGPYTVNDDCTGFLDFSSNLTNPPHVAHGNFVIVDQGNELYFVDNEDGWAAIAVGKRM